MNLSKMEKLIRWMFYCGGLGMLLMLLFELFVPMLYFDYVVWPAYPFYESLIYCCFIGFLIVLMGIMIVFDEREDRL